MFFCAIRMEQQHKLTLFTWTTAATKLGSRTPPYLTSWLHSWSDSKAELSSSRTSFLSFPVLSRTVTLSSDRGTQPWHRCYGYKQHKCLASSYLSYLSESVIHLHHPVRNKSRAKGSCGDTCAALFIRGFYLVAHYLFCVDVLRPGPASSLYFPTDQPPSVSLVLVFSLHPGSGFSLMYNCPTCQTIYAFYGLCI